MAVPTRVRIPALLDIVTMDDGSTQIRPSILDSLPKDSTIASTSGGGTSNQKKNNTGKDNFRTILAYTENDMAGAVLASGGRHMVLALKGDIWTWGRNAFYVDIPFNEEDVL